MNLTRLPLALSVLAVVPAAVALRPAAETIDLTPRFKAEQSFSFTQKFQAEGALDELSVMVNGSPMIDDSAISADMAFDGTIEMTEEILEVRDGQISRVRITVGTMDMAVSGEVDAMGEGQTIDETMEPELVGRTIEIAIDEDGEVTRTDVTEDMDPLDDDALAGITHENHFEMLLPSEPVEEGEEFELAPDWQELIREAMGSMDSADMGEDERRAAEGLMEAFLDAATLDATGKVTGVEDGVATIEYELSASMTIDDLVALIQSIAPPGEMDQIPPGIESMVEATAEFSGTGEFDLELGQMVAVDLAGDFEVSASGNADMDGNSASAEMLMSGSMEISAELAAE